MAPIFRQFLLEDIHSVANGFSLYVKSNTYNCVKNEKRELERELQTPSYFLSFAQLTNQSEK